jgi:hypothetical protein
MNYVKPLAMYVFAQDEKQAFMDFVSEVHAPIGSWLFILYNMFRPTYSLLVCKTCCTLV